MNSFSSFIVKVSLKPYLLSKSEGLTNIVVSKFVPSVIISPFLLNTLLLQFFNLHSLFSFSHIICLANNFDFITVPSKPSSVTLYPMSILLSYLSRYKYELSSTLKCTFLSEKKYGLLIYIISKATLSLFR